MSSSSTPAPSHVPSSPRIISNDFDDLPPPPPDNDTTNNQESFHASFSSYIDPVASMDYYTSTPEPQSSSDMPRVHPPSFVMHDDQVMSQPGCQPVTEHHMFPATADYSYMTENFALNSVVNGNIPPTQDRLHYPNTYWHMGSGAQQLITPHVQHHDHGFHPYSRVAGARSPLALIPPRFEPLSPPLTTSPPSGRYHHAQLEQSPSHSVSPVMVSPASAMSELGSELSPTNLGWYQPLLPTEYEGATATSPTGLTPSLGLGMSMMSDTPYSVSPSASRKPRSGKATKNRITRSQATARVPKKEWSEDLDLLETTNNLDLSSESPEHRGSRKTAFLSAEQKLARVIKERGRRHKARDAFDELRDVLPKTIPAGSKTVTLHRAVDHITVADHKILMYEKEVSALKQELQAVRAEASRKERHHEMILANALAHQTGEGSSPQSARGTI